MTFSYGETTLEAYGEKNARISQDIAGGLTAEKLLMGYFGNRVHEDNTLHMEDDSDGVYRLLTEGLEALSDIAEFYATDAFGAMKVWPPAGVALGCGWRGICCGWTSA